MPRCFQIAFRLAAGNIEAVDLTLFWAELRTKQFVIPFAPQQKHAEVYGERFNWRSFLSALVYRQGGVRPVPTRRAIMAWKAPKIVEVPVGMEINMYACAARK
jgi:coenzyme PQQ precursor peptide PqqA